METKFNVLDCGKLKSVLLDVESNLFQEVVRMRKSRAPKPLQSSVKGALLAVRTALYICNNFLFYFMSLPASDLSDVDNSISDGKA